MPRAYNQVCPIARTLDIIGDRWTLLIVRDLFMGRSRFTDLLRSSPGLPARILAERLKRLEKHGLVEREVYSQHPLRAEYHLTDDGYSLKPVMEAIFRWGMENCFQDDPQGKKALLALFPGGTPIPPPRRPA